MERVANYHIRVQGQLSASLAGWFEPMTVTIEQDPDCEPSTLLTGHVDQAALHGALLKIRDLNLTLLTVQRVDPESSQ